MDAVTQSSRGSASTALLHWPRNCVTGRLLSKVRAVLKATRMHGGRKAQSHDAGYNPGVTLRAAAVHHP